MIKPLTKAFAILGISLASIGFARASSTVERIAAVDYDTIWNEYGTPFVNEDWYQSLTFPQNQQYYPGQYVYYQPHAQFEVSSIVQAEHYYFEISPVSRWDSHMSGPEQPSLYWYEGTGTIAASDFNVGTKIASFSISPPGEAWYVPNSIGGFTGDTYVDITDAVKSAQASSWAFLGLNIQTPPDGQSAGSFRAPYIIASNQPLPSAVIGVAVPGPIAGAGLPALAGLGALVFCRRYRRASRK